MVQYPHTAELKNNDTTLLYKARLEFTTNTRVMNFNGSETLVKGIVYIPLPIADIAVNWSCKIYNVQYTGGGVATGTAGVFSWKPGVQVKAGVTILPGGTIFPVDGNSVTVADWIGWKPRIERIGQGTMKDGVDYTWNINTGLFQLRTGDKFQLNEWFYITFDPKLNGQVIVDEQTLIDLGNTVLYNGTVKQFSRGQLNARLWV